MPVPRELPDHNKLYLYVIHTLSFVVETRSKPTKTWGRTKRSFRVIPHTIKRDKSTILIDLRAYRSPDSGFWFPAGLEPLKLIKMSQMNPILAVLLSLVGLYLLYAACLYLFQHAIMFPGMRTLEANEPPDLPRGAECFWVEAEGQPVEGWFLPPTDETAAKSPLVPGR